MIKYSEIQIGQRFGRLTVIDKPFKYGKAFKVKCRCSCGDLVEKFIHNLKTGPSIKRRLKKGWSIEAAMETPIRSKAFAEITK